MRAWSTVWVMLFAGACGGGKGPGSDTDDLAPVVDLATEASALEVEVEVAGDLVEAQRAVSTILAAQLAAVLDPNVHLTLGVPAKTAAAPCWTSGPLQTAFSVDYKQCGSLGLGGVLHVHDHAFAPLTLSFLQFKVNDRQVDGVMALDGGAEGGFFSTWDTTSADPGPESRAPFGVQTGFAASGLSWEGGLELDTTGNRLAQWGVASVEGSEGTVRTIRVGGTDAASLLGDGAPEDPLEASLSYATCRCPSQGTIAYELDGRITRLLIDLDDLEAQDDGIDDPELRIPIELPLTGDAVVETVGCGQYEVSMDLDPIEVPVAGAQVATRIQAQCDALAIEASRCEALVATASAKDFRFTIPPDTLLPAVQAAVNIQFDGSWCMF